MKVLLIGLEWFGGITEAVEYALQKNGCSVTRVYYRTSDWWWKESGAKRKAKIYYQKLTGAKRYEKKVVRQCQQHNHQAMMSATGKEYDLILVLKGCHLTYETIAELKSRCAAPLFLWVFDDPILTWDGTCSLRQEDIRKYPLYNAIFVFDDYYVDKLKAHFGNKTFYLPLAFNEDVFKPLADAVREYPLAFVGAGFPHRVDLFKRFADRGLHLWGYNWQQLQKHVAGGVVMPAAANEIYNRSHIVLNLNHQQSIWSTNARTFEVLGGKNFILTDYRPNLEQMFLLDKEIVCFRTEDECVEKIDYYLTHPETLAQTAAAGQARVLKEHTYTHRMRELLTYL